MVAGAADAAAAAATVEAGAAAAVAVAAVTVESAMAVSSALFTSALDSIALADDEHVASLTDIACDLVISVVVVAMIGAVSTWPPISFVLSSGPVLFDCCDLRDCDAKTIQSNAIRVTTQPPTDSNAFEFGDGNALGNALENGRPTFALG